jgi:hypothetical protein
MSFLALPMLVWGRYSMATPPSTRRPSQPATHPTSERMPQSRALVARSALAFLLAGAVGCASDVLLPNPAGGPAALTLVDGDLQTGTVGELLSHPLTVQVLAGDQPVPGRKVAFVLTADPAAGTITPDTAVTGSDGKAVAHWTLGTAPGDHLVVAQLVGDESATQIAEFHAAAKVGAPATLSLSLGSVLSQAGQRNQAVATAPAVRVVDRFGNPVPDATVAWQVTSGRGQVGAPNTTTDAEGKTSVVWTLGDRIGVQKLTAAIGGVTGSPVTFTATVLF